MKIESNETGYLIEVSPEEMRIIRAALFAAPSAQSIYDAIEGHLDGEYCKAHDC